jgi:hypothetical protein
VKPYIAISAAILAASGFCLGSYEIGAHDGRQHLLNQQWDAHHPGADYINVKDCELLSQDGKWWYECDVKR